MNLKIVDLEIPEPPPLDSKQLYVILHGLVSIVETADTLFLFLLDMDKDHEYRAGTWLAEQEVVKGIKGELKGVQAGTKRLDPLANPLLKLATLPDFDQPEVHAVFQAPIPKDILSFNRGMITVNGGATSLVATPATLSAVRVLVYDVETDFNSVKLIGTTGGDESEADIFSWDAHEAFTTFGNGARLATLHIFDMPGGPLADDSPHHVEEFAVSSRVLGAEITIGAAVPLTVTNGPLPAGLSELEMLDFDVRATRISDLVLDFIRVGEWIQSGDVEGSCDSCCGGCDGRMP
jgi:hypothetical protein